MKVLLTGATGMLGPALLEGLAADRRVGRIFVLAHRRAPLPLPKTQVVWGDLARRPAFGLSNSTVEQLQAEVTAILHAGALTRFSARLEDARRANTGGAANLLAFAASCPRLERFCYLSTVHVAGRRTGVIAEDELLHDAGFVNNYERSKYEAERLLREAAPRLPISVLRLSTVLGESRSGAVPRLGGVHHALRLLYHGLAPMLPGAPTSLVDVIALDYAAQAVLHLFGRGFERGSTLHICAAADALPLDTFLDQTMQAFLRYRPAWRRRAIEKPVTTDLRTFELFVNSVDETGDTALRSSLELIRHFAPQLAFPKRFDDRRCAAALAIAGIRRPSTQELLETVLRSLVEDKWSSSSTPAGVHA